MSGYYIYSLHTCVKKQMETEGGGNTLSTPFKNPQQAPAVWVLIACLFSWLSAITSAKDLKLLRPAELIIAMPVRIYLPFSA